MLRKTLAAASGLALTLVLGCGQSPPATAKQRWSILRGKGGGSHPDRDAPGVKIVCRSKTCGEHAFHIHEKGVAPRRILPAPAATLIPPASIMA